MNANKSLILQTTSAGAFASLPKTRLEVQLVVAYRDGRAVTFVGQPPRSNMLRTSLIYVIDASDQSSSTTLQLPAKGDIYFFQASLSARWRVVDAAEIVKRKVSDGQSLVLSFLHDHVRRVVRAYEPRESAAAEAAVLDNVPLPRRLPEGIEIFAFSCRLTMDPNLHKRALALDELSYKRDAGRLVMAKTADDVSALERIVNGNESLMFLHLAQHPGDTATVMNLIAASRDRDEHARLELFDRMLDKGFIQDADIGPLRDRVLGAPAPAITAPIPHTLAPINPATEDEALDINAQQVPDDQVAIYEPNPESAPAASDNVTAWRPIKRAARNGEME